jgi:putative sigma-54 modulation protein
MEAHEQDPPSTQSLMKMADGAIPHSSCGSLTRNEEGIMQIAVYKCGTDLAQALRSYVERRLRFSLDRFGGLVGRATVRISPDGPKEIRCFVSIEVDTLGPIAVEERDADLFAAIDRATGKLGRLVGRELERSRDARMSRESVRLVA